MNAIDALHPMYRDIANARRLKILVCGDRHWADYAYIASNLSAFVRYYHAESVCIVHGDCHGADRLAAEWARNYGHEIHPYPAAWDARGKSAGPMRNRAMLSEEHPDVVIAFHDDLLKSRGTKDMLRAADERGVPTVRLSHTKPWVPPVEEPTQA